MIQTEFPFALPRGYLDTDGTLHREGVMRLATAFDEIAPMKDPRVQANAGYLVIILFSRVIVRLGTLTTINPKVIEGLFSADLAYLQDLYTRINQNGHSRMAITCPHCEGTFEVEAGGLGVIGYPSGRLLEEVAYLAYYLHWSYNDILEMDHRERQTWVSEVSRINRRLSDADAEGR